MLSAMANMAPALPTASQLLRLNQEPVEEEEQAVDGLRLHAPPSAKL